jgi:hypothetical protein
MKRKLLLLNALLAGGFILGATELYRQVLDGDARYDRLQVFSDPRQPPEFPSPADPTPTRAGNFMPIVDRLLFSADRNADIIIETVETEVASRPGLPHLAGLVDFGDGPSALMTADAGEPATWISVGGKIGAFVFEGVDGEEVKLSWNEEQFTVTKEQLNETPVAVRKPPVRPPPGPRGGRPTAATAANAAGDLAGVGQNSRIGPEMSPGVYRVVPGDDSPAGTEHEGFIKKTRSTPFGATAWWEKNEQ